MLPTGEMTTVVVIYYDNYGKFETFLIVLYLGINPGIIWK